MLGSNTKIRQRLILSLGGCNRNMEKSFLAIDSLEKSYPDRIVFSSLSCSFAYNGLYLLLGGNGSGKSTLLNILSGKDKEWSGRLCFSNKELLKKDRDWFSDTYVSYVAQDSLVFEDEKLIDDFLLPFEKKDKERAKEILKSLGLETVLDEKCRELSEGEKERLCFGQAIYADKKIVLLDEITANLDPLSTEKILRYVLELSKNRLVIFATHDGLPEWFLKDANILRRKDGKISKEQEVICKEEKNTTKETKEKHRSFLSDAFTTRKEEKKTHWLLGTLCCLFSFLCVLLCSFYGSFKDINQIGADGSTVIVNPLEEISKNVFFETSPVFLTREKCEDSYTALDLHYYPNCKDEDYRKSGSLFAGVLKFDEKDSDKPVLVDGAYPLNQGDAIISDVCFSSMTGYALGDEIDLGLKKYKIVGVYKAKNKDGIDSRYSQYPFKDNSISINRNVRLCYSFMTESVFVRDDSQKPEFYACKSIKQNKDIFRKDNFMDTDFSFTSIYRGRYAPVCVDGNGKENLTFFRGYLGHLVFGILSAAVLLIFLVVLAFSVYRKNKRKYILLRYRGSSRKRLIQNNLLSFGFSSFVGICLGIGISEIALLIRNRVYTKALGAASLTLFFSFNYSILILLGVFLAFRILLFVVFNYLLCPKDRSRLIEEVKKKA